MTENEQREIQQQLAVSAARLAETVDAEEKRRQEICRLRAEACAGIAEQKAYEKKKMQEEAARDRNNMVRQKARIQDAIGKGDVKELERLLREMASST